MSFIQKAAFINDTSQIADGVIQTADLANGAVTAIKMSSVLDHDHTTTLDDGGALTDLTRIEGSRLYALILLQGGSST